MEQADQGDRFEARVTHVTHLDFNLRSAAGGLYPAGRDAADIIARLHAEIVKILAQPDMKERMLAVGFEPVGDPPDKFAAYLRAEAEKWSQVVRQADIRID